jgi:cytoskeletal protein CcmA (bactofilin family)
MTTTTVRPKAEFFPAPKTEQTTGAPNCVVAQGTKIEGQFRSAESVRLDGLVIGDVMCDKKLVLGESGKVQGKLMSNDAVIMGHVVGELKITGVLHLVSTALIEGNITARKMIVEEGARYNGECKIGE